MFLHTLIDILRNSILITGLVIVMMMMMVMIATTHPSSP